AGCVSESVAAPGVVAASSNSFSSSSSSSFNNNSNNNSSSSSSSGGQGNGNGVFLQSTLQAYTAAITHHGKFRQWRAAWVSRPQMAVVLQEDSLGEPWRVVLPDAPPGLGLKEASSKVPGAVLEAYCNVEGMDAEQLEKFVEGNGQWANAVMEVAPYLNAEQLVYGLSILDQAGLNVQEIKMLNQLQAPEILKVNVQQKQRALLHELQLLRSMAFDKKTSAEPVGWSAWQQMQAWQPQGWQQ
ncbi:unnamed protein product, partial [Polarella glacialis]